MKKDLSNAAVIYPSVVYNEYLNIYHCNHNGYYFGGFPLAFQSAVEPSHIFIRYLLGVYRCIHFITHHAPIES